MNYSFHPAARLDLQEAAEYYRERGGVALAQALFTAFENTMGLLMQHPLLGVPWKHGTRRLVMKHFPYAIVYRVLDTEICVLAVSHNNRRPGYWKQRIIQQ